MDDVRSGTTKALRDIRPRTVEIKFVDIPEVEFERFGDAVVEGQQVEDRECMIQGGGEECNPEKQCSCRAVYREREMKELQSLVSCPGRNMLNHASC